MPVNNAAARRNLGGPPALGSRAIPSGLLDKNQLDHPNIGHSFARDVRGP
jgi:hypothetical protein